MGATQSFHTVSEDLCQFNTKYRRTFILQMHDIEARDSTTPLRNRDVRIVQLDSLHEIEVLILLGQLSGRHDRQIARERRRVSGGMSEGEGTTGRDAGEGAILGKNVVVARNLDVKKGKAMVDGRYLTRQERDGACRRERRERP